MRGLKDFFRFLRKGVWDVGTDFGDRKWEIGRETEEEGLRLSCHFFFPHIFSWQRNDEGQATMNDSGQGVLPFSFQPAWIFGQVSFWLGQRFLGDEVLFYVIPLGCFMRKEGFSFDWRRKEGIPFRKDYEIFMTYHNFSLILQLHLFLLPCPSSPFCIISWT